MTVSAPTHALRPAARTAGRVGLAAARALAGAYDALPLTPQWLADRAIDVHFDRRKRATSAHHEWSAIEDRRANDNGTVTLLSDDLTIGDWLRQDEIGADLVPDPVWLPVARAVVNATARRALAGVVEAVQLATRGWADCDTYSLDWTLCTRLAAQLDHLADTTHGFPGTEQYPTPELWEADMRAAAAGLRGWATKESSPTKTALLDATGDTWDIIAEADRLDEQRRLDEARAALEWVAANLHDLWD